MKVNGKSQPAWLHTCALLLGIGCLLGIAVGTWVSMASWPLPGIDAGHSTTLRPPVLALPIHRVLGVLIALLSAATAMGALKSDNSAVRSAGWWPLVLTVAAAGLVSPPAFAAGRGIVTLLHALCAQLVLASAAAVYILTSPSVVVEQRVEQIKDTWKPSLRTLSLLIPALVLLEILLAEGYRRGFIPVLWHVPTAVLVLVLNLVVGVGVMKQFRSHKPLRVASHSLVGITAVEVLLGLAAYTLLMLSSSLTYPLAIVASIHAFTGSLVMAIAVIFAVQIRRSIAKT